MAPFTPMNPVEKEPASKSLALCKHPLTNPTELLVFLRDLKVQPKKSLSQNFLVDGNILQKILKESAIVKGDTILEIGPGPGALTEAMVALGAQVYAVEQDYVFAQALKRLDSVTVFTQDILTFDFSILPKNTKVVSNLPYHLTAPILTLLAPRHDIFSKITLMVQEEVARRITARPKSKEYGSLTVFLHFYSHPRYAFFVSKNCFYPRPNVDSAVVTLELKEPPKLNEEAFFAFVRQAFQHRRKMLTTTFDASIGQLLEELGENPKARPEELSLDAFLKLYVLAKES